MTDQQHEELRDRFEREYSKRLAESAGVPREQTAAALVAMRIGYGYKELYESGLWGGYTLAHNNIDNGGHAAYCEALTHVDQVESLVETAQRRLRRLKEGERVQLWYVSAVTVCYYSRNYSDALKWLASAATLMDEAGIKGVELSLDSTYVWASELPEYLDGYSGTPNAWVLHHQIENDRRHRIQGARK